MALSDGINLGNFQGAASFYRCMFFLCVVIFAIVVFVLTGPKVCLESQQKGIEGQIAAVDLELATIRMAALTDANEIAQLDAEELNLANSEQIFKDGTDKASVWRADARWSEMGKARVHEIWSRRQVLQVRLSDYNALQREKMGALTLLKARAEQNMFLQDVCKQRRFKLLGILLLSGFGIVLFAVLWHALVQSKINRLLQKFSH